MDDRIREILYMVHTQRFKLISANCYGCINDCPSQKDHPCLWDNGDEYKGEALALLYGQGLITEDEYSETLNYL
jgi:hypothetical protein